VGSLWSNSLDIICWLDLEESHTTSLNRSNSVCVNAFSHPTQKKKKKKKNFETLGPKLFNGRVSEKDVKDVCKTCLYFAIHTF